MKCPGQDMQFWDNDAIYEVKCPECGKMVEFYKDDTTRKCNQCSHRFVNPKMDFGCATYCQFAEQCLGTLPEEFVLQQDNLFKDKVAVAVKRYFKSDFKRIRLTTQLADHAEKIGKETEDANLALILCSAYLLLIDCESLTLREVRTSFIEKWNANPDTATELLTSVGANETLIGQVVRIITGNPADNEVEQIACNVVQNAFNITLLEAECRENDISRDEITAEIEKLSSAAAKKEAQRVLPPT